MLRLRRIKSCVLLALSMDGRKTVVNSFVIFRVDYCNSLLAGVPRYQLDRLQSVMNTAARLSAPRSRIISSTCCGTAFINFPFRSASSSSCMAGTVVHRQPPCRKVTTVGSRQRLLYATGDLVRLLCHALCHPCICCGGF